MADATKILGQAALAATTLTDVYTTPGATSTTISSYVVCNRSAASTTWRMSVCQGGAADTNAQYNYYDLPIPGNETFVGTIGVTLAAGDVIRFYAAAATISVSVYGVEVT
jgi:hypothetical protein